MGKKNIYDKDETKKVAIFNKFSLHKKFSLV